MVPSVLLALALLFFGALWRLAGALPCWCSHTLWLPLLHLGALSPLMAAALEGFGALRLLGCAHEWWCSLMAWLALAQWCFRREWLRRSMVLVPSNYLADHARASWCAHSPWLGRSVSLWLSSIMAYTLRAVGALILHGCRRQEARSPPLCLSRISWVLAEYAGVKAEKPIATDPRRLG